jgi:hypothetical protein
VRISGERFFRQYTSQDAIAKFAKATAGFGITYLLDHDYKSVYVGALDLLPQQTREGGIPCWNSVAGQESISALAFCVEPEGD